MLWLASAHAQPALTAREVSEAIALGKACKAPIVRFTGPQYDVFVESPFARVALNAAVIVINNMSLDSPAMRNAVIPGYRIWAATKFTLPTKATITEISVRPKGGSEIRPVAERHARLFVGTVPSHGIIEELRARFPQYEFPALPSGDYDVVVHSDRGARVFRVTADQRAQLLDVCNPGP